MKFEVKKYSSEDWKELSIIHSLIFKEERNQGIDRIDFGLLLIDKSIDSPCGFITCRELDSKTLYWQFGGAIPHYQKSIHVYKGFLELYTWCKKEGYTKVLTYVKNNNFSMLKFYLGLKAEIIGVKNINNEILLEHLINL